jgi:hypothetical protein
LLSCSRQPSHACNILSRRRLTEGVARPTVAGPIFPSVPCSRSGVVPDRPWLETLRTPNKAVHYAACGSGARWLHWDIDAEFDEAVNQKLSGPTARRAATPPARCQLLFSGWSSFTVEMTPVTSTSRQSPNVVKSAHSASSQNTAPVLSP